MRYISICVLSYKRPDWLRETIESIRSTVAFPHEIIVNSDGGDDQENVDYLNTKLRKGHISKLILNHGKNRGVGKSLSNCIKIAEGDYIAKVDTDLTFESGWGLESVSLLDKYPDVGAVGLFDYKRYDPNDTRFVVEEEREDCRIVNDLVSSVYIFRREDVGLGGWEHDDGFHQRLKQYNGLLALTKTDMAQNKGFGIGKSVYVSGTMENPRKTETFDVPHIIEYEQ